MRAFKLAWHLALLISSSFHLCSSSKPAELMLDATPRAQVITGLIEGFVSAEPDLAACIGDASGDLRSLDAALSDILKRDLASIAAGLHKIANILKEMPVLAAKCKASKADVKDITDTLKQIHDLKDLGTHIWSDLMVHGKDIGTQISNAAAAYQAHEYLEVGRKIGVALRLVVVGKAAREPLPPPPQPPYNRDMRLRNPREMVRAEAGDQIDVHWNLSPLLIESAHDWAGGLGFFHVSVGFTNTRTGLNSTIEFAADKFDLTLITPTLNYSDRTMTWKNTATVKPLEGALDVNYWQFRTQLATINASTYNAMLSWLDDAVKNFTIYNLFVLADSNQVKPDAGGFSCFDFAQAALEQLAKLAGPCVFDQSLPGILRNDVIMLGNGTAGRTAASPEDAFSFFAAVVKIPDLWSLNYNETITEMARLASEQRKRSAIYHDTAGRYWSYKPRRPFFAISKSFAPLPGTCHQAETILV